MDMESQTSDYNPQSFDAIISVILTRIAELDRVNEERDLVTKSLLQNILDEQKDMGGRISQLENSGTSNQKNIDNLTNTVDIQFKEVFKVLEAQVEDIEITVTKCRRSHKNRFALVTGTIVAIFGTIWTIWGVDIRNHILIGETQVRIIAQDVINDYISIVNHELKKKSNSR